jgi:hypothetical protein
MGKRSIAMRLLPILLAAVFAGCAPPSAASKATPSPQTGSSASAAVSPEGDPQAVFLAAFREASERKNLEQMLKLYCWNGVDAQMRETVRENVQDELRQPIAGIEFVAVDPGKYGPRDEGGIRWKPNLNVVSVVKVRYTPPPPGSGLSVSEAKHTVGLQGGQYKITVPIRDQ